MAIGRVRRLARVPAEELGRAADGIVAALDRRLRIVTPDTVNDVAELPPARDFEGRMMYVKGAVHRLYMSDGSNWRQVTVV